MLKSATFLLLVILNLSCFGKGDTSKVAEYLFDRSLTDNVSKLPLKAYGGSFTDDRFGNEERAYLIPGNYSDYLNLGVRPDLKNRQQTISLWVKIYQNIMSGYGIQHNPILFTRSHAGQDFNEAFYIGYDFSLRKFNVCTSLSDLKQISIYQKGTAYLNQWYHLVVSFDDHRLSFYINGKLESSQPKSFSSAYLPTDSVIIGNRTSIRNNRYFLGNVDDIRFYNRVLSPDEVSELFNEPNPNRSTIILNIVLACLMAIAAIMAIVYYIRKRIEKGIAVEKEKNALRNHWYEQENRVLTAQMDPHFIFNSLNTIQQFIITHDNENAQKYLSKFSKLIRKLIESNTNESISLKEEIEILEKYIEIESLRFNNVFNFQIMVPDDIDAGKLQIPHFLIQPVVENAIWHGLLLKPGNKELTISFRRSEPRSIICIVDDNGVGRKNASPPGRGIEKRKSLAINFIEQRLEVMSKMLKGNFGIEVIDKENAQGESEGTRVILTLPVLTG